MVTWFDGAEIAGVLDLTDVLLTESAVALLRTYPPAPPKISAARKTMAAPRMPPDDR